MHSLLLATLVVTATADGGPSLQCLEGTYPASGSVFIWIRRFASRWCERDDGVREGPFEAYWGEGQLYTRGECKNGKREGTWTNFWGNGKPGYVRSFHEGRRETTLTKLSRDGQKIEEVTELPDGRIRLQGWRQNGSPRFDCTRSSDGTRGDCQRWDSAKVRWEEHDERGKTEGPVSAHDTDGTLREEGTYHQGLREGLWTTYRTDGSKFETGVYLHGKREGEWKEWSRSSSVRVTRYRKGEKVGQKPESPKDLIGIIAARSGQLSKGEPMDYFVDPSEDDAEVLERSVLVRVGASKPPAHGPCGNPAER